MPLDDDGVTYFPALAPKVHIATAALINLYLEGCTGQQCLPSSSTAQPEIP